MQTRRLNASKNRIVEITKPRGFERNLVPDAIVGTALDAKQDNVRMYLMRWHGTTELDLVRASEVLEKCPQVAIRYLEQTSSLVRKCAERKRIYEQSVANRSAHPDEVLVAESADVGKTLEALVADALQEEPEQVEAIEPAIEAASATPENAPVQPIVADSAAMAIDEPIQPDDLIDDTESFLKEVSDRVAQHEQRIESLPENTAVANSSS